MNPLSGKILRLSFGIVGLFFTPGKIIAGAPAEALPLAESLFRPPAIILPALSPDGRQLVYGTVENKRTLVVYLDLVSGIARPLVRAQKLQALFWKGNGTVVLSDSTAMAVIVVDLATSSARNATEIKKGDVGSFSIVVNPVSSSPNDIIVDDFISTDTARLNITTWAREILFKGDQRSLPGVKTACYVADATGIVRARLYETPAQNELQVREYSGEAFKTIRRWPADGPGWTPVAFSEDGNGLWVLTDDDADCGALHLYDLRKNTLGPASDLKFGLQHGGGILSGNGRKLLGVYFYDDRMHGAWLDGARAILQGKLESSFPDKNVSVVSSSFDETVHIVEVSSDREASSWYILDLRKPSLTLLAKEAPLLPAERMPACRYVDIPARDGFVLHGYLTTPAEAHGPSPLLLMPNTNPYHSRFISGYDAEPVFWASRGYTVLRLNYRGAYGYGQSYLQAGAGELDGRMIDDINDAARWSVDQHYTEAGKILLCGGELAAGMSLVAAAECPELYCGVVSIAGTLDWSHQLEAQRSASVPANRMFNATRLKTRAPYVAARKLAVPFLPLSVFQLRDWDAPLRNAFGRNDKNLKKAKPMEGDAGAFNAEAYSIYYVKQIEPFLADCLRGPKMGAK